MLNIPPWIEQVYTQLSLASFPHKPTTVFTHLSYPSPPMLPPWLPAKFTLYWLQSSYCAAYRAHTVKSVNAKVATLPVYNTTDCYTSTWMISVDTCWLACVLNSRECLTGYLHCLQVRHTTSHRWEGESS